MNLSPPRRYRRLAPTCSIFLDRRSGARSEGQSVARENLNAFQTDRMSVCPPSRLWRDKTRNTPHVARSDLSVSEISQYSHSSSNPRVPRPSHPALAISCVLISSETDLHAKSRSAAPHVIPYTLLEHSAAFSPFAVPLARRETG